MIIDDFIYGSTTVDEPVLIDLIGSRAMQRLDLVLQHGITGLIGVSKPVTRLEHSIGAMLLVRRLGANLPEQIAALLHDVSHTAFSHVIDHALGDALVQSYHEEHKEAYLRTTDVPEVLRRHGYDWRDFLDDTRYTLLEQDAPALCGDRVDYFLRDAEALNLLSRTEIQQLLSHFVVHAGRIMMDDVAAARLLAENFMAADDASWSSFHEVGLYELTSIAIRHAMAIGVFTEADIWSTDAIVWEKLCSAEDAQLQQTIALIAAETRFVTDTANPLIEVRPKIRTVDPDVVINGSPYPLSTLDPKYALTRQAYLQRKQKLWQMSVAA